MTSARQDAWNQDEDLLLAEVVLRHIREGSTQLAAFDEVGRKLSRTSSACGFRWNSYVRKQYKSAIEIAKEQRKDKSVKRVDTYDDFKQGTEQRQENVLDEKQPHDSLTFEQVLTFLQKMQQKITSNKGIIQDYEKLEDKLDKLKGENEILKQDLNSYKEKCQLIEEDYKALIEIMERARKMVVLNEGDDDQQMRFQMDRNGNLERVKK